MGFLFGKKKAQETAEGASPAPSKAASSRSPATGSVARGGAHTRQSRRVVAAPVGKAAAPPKAAVVVSPSSPDELSLQDAPAPARSASTSPILASEPPAFTGSLGSSGPARTGDAALIEFLVGQAQLITAEQGAAARAKAQAEGIPLDVALTSQGIITEEAILNALSQARYFPHLQLDRYAIRKKALDTVSKEDAAKYSVMPVDKLGSLLQLAMVNPLDEETVSMIHARTGLEVKRCIATRAELARGIEKWYGGQAQAQDASISFVAEPTQETRSMTQVLGNVQVTVPATTSSQRVDIAPEIQDIDDLLSADEVIAPSIVEPIQLDEAPLIVPADEVVELAAPAKAPSALEPRNRPAGLVVESSPSGEIALEEVPITRPVARPVAAEPQAFIQLVPVLEDEFKHAITHNKAHVFEKWVGLQTRNRIINAVPVDQPVQDLLAEALT